MGTHVKAADAAPFDVIIDRERSLLLAEAPPTPEKALQIQQQLGPDGRWSDINYEDQQRGGWNPRRHLERVLTMCQAMVNPRSSLHGNPSLAAGIDLALDDWIAHRYHCPNWWHNEIGVPFLMRQIILLLGENLSDARRAGALELLHQYRAGGVGANLVWSATLALNYGCLTRDEALVKQSATQLINEIKVTDGDGIQSDFSFHQHGPRLQSFGYGASYQGDASRLAWTLKDTPWALPPAQVRLLIDHAVQGMSWMSRWNRTVPGTMDRGISRLDATDVASLAESCKFLALADPTRSAELDAVSGRVERRGLPLSGFRSFPRSDFACYHRPAFSFFVKTVSNRTLLTESINSENLKGQRLGCGDTYLLRDGNEYDNLVPVWDWTLLPGVTAAAGLEAVERKQFTGAVSDGESGLSAMDFKVGDAKKTSSLEARKAYFCHGDMVVCLIGDLSVQAGDTPARTALNQCLLRGPVAVGDQTGGYSTVKPDEVSLGKGRWIHHDGFLYLSLGNPALSVRTGLAAGTWRSINQSGTRTLVEKPIFLPFLDHGAKIDHQACGYAILACNAVGQAENLARSPGFRVVRNDDGCQAIQWNDGTVMAAFYKSGELRDGGAPLLTVDQPCLLLSRASRLFASEPLHRSTEIHATVGAHPPLSIRLPGDGTSVETQLPF